MANPYDTKDVICEYIRLNEGIEVYPNEVNFANPVRSEPTPIPLRNTHVVITPVTSSGLYGKRIFHYNRIHISELGTVTVEKGSATTVYQLLSAINVKYGLYLTEDDVIDQVLSPIITGEIEVDLEIKPTSLAWYAGDIIPVTE